MSEPSVVAAVDLGSNSFRLQIARVAHGGGLLPQDSIKEAVRLGAGLDEDKCLTPEACERALIALARFAERLRGLPPQSVRAVATHTLRVARNAEEFLVAAEATLGFPIEIIAGQEEARLIFVGAAHSLPSSRETRLVVDIGGGSTEFIIGLQTRPLKIESKQLGCVTWSRRFFPDGKITEERLAAAELAARGSLQNLAKDFHAGHWERAVGTSGTASSLFNILQLNDFSPAGITAEGLARLRQAMIEARHVDRLELNGLRTDRRAVLPGGYAIMAAIFDMFDIPQMGITDGALRDGVLYDLLARHGNKDVREQSVHQFLHRYHVDLAQSERVAGLARDMFDRLLPDDQTLERNELARHLLMAARLHEVGLSISHTGYRRHSAYILQHADIPGFSRREQALMARLVEAHRGRLTKINLDDFSRKERGALACLRLAVLFCRARQDELPRILDFRRKHGVYTLELEPGWLDAHPLTSHVVTEEIRIWQEIGVTLNVIPAPAA